jgi:hypothetical protein
MIINTKQEGLSNMAGKIKVTGYRDTGTEIYVGLTGGKGNLLVYTADEYPAGGYDALSDEDLKAQIVSKL